ncbi:MAG: pilus assembly FimT family protein [Patescibacteria group bacterium]
MKKGFTLIEFLVVFSVLMVVLVLSISTFFILTRKTDFDTCYDNIFSTLNLARNKTLASEQAAQYGIYFDTLSDPDRYVLFKGPNYTARDISFDEIHDIPLPLSISNIVLNGGVSEVVFNRLDGITNNYGFITIRSAATNEERTIYIYLSGKISTQSPPVSSAGRIIDSRHTHFDLGWSIAGATTLKFDFVNAGQIEQVSMAGYFSPAGFDWEGEFLVNNVSQHFIIHTHQLDPTTILCIHRDRNDGKNTEEVYIYIIQDGIEKEIAHYDDDLSASVTKGTYVWNQMDIQ